MAHPFRNSFQALCLAACLPAGPAAFARSEAEAMTGTPAAPAGEAEGNEDQAPVTSLAEALELTYRNSPTLLAERQKSRASDFGVLAARAAFGPSITYQGRYGYEEDKVQRAPSANFSTLSGWSSSVAGVLNQPLFTFGRNAAGYREAQAQADYAQAGLRSTEAQVMLDAVAAYVGVIRDRNAVTIAGEYLQTLEREFRENAERLEKHETTASDVHQAGTRVELARGQLLSSRQLAASSEASFLALTGVPAGTLQPPEPLSPFPRTLEDALAMGEQHSPGVAAAYARERVSRAQEGAARAEFMPRVDLRGTASYGSVTPYSDNMRERQVSGAVVVSGTLFNSGQRRAKLHAADAANEADWRLIDAALRENRRQIADSWNLWRAQSDATERLRVAIDHAQRAFDGAVIQERAGLRTSLEVLDLARDVLIARSDYNSAAATAYLAQARLLALSGMLEAGSLATSTARADEPASARRGGGLPLVTPTLMTLDGLLAGKTSNRQPRDASAGRMAPEVSTNLDTSHDPAVP